MWGPCWFNDHSMLACSRSWYTCSRLAIGYEWDDGWDDSDTVGKHGVFTFVSQTVLHEACDLQEGVLVLLEKGLWRPAWMTNTSFIAFIIGKLIKSHRWIIDVLCITLFKALPLASSPTRLVTWWVEYLDCRRWHGHGSMRSRRLVHPQLNYTAKSCDY